MDILIKTLLTILGGVGLLGLIAIFILVFPEKVKLIQSSIAQSIGRFSFWARKSTIKNRIEGHCDGAIKDFHREMPDVDIPKLVVEWVDGNNVDTIVKDNEAIVLLQYSRNDTLNIVKATTAYVKDAFLVHAKPYLSSSLRNSLDLSVIRYVLQRVSKNSKSSLSRFINEHAEELHDNSATINKIEKVNDAGLFTRLLIRELDTYGNALVGRIPEQEHQKEADDFLEFLYQIATREPDEYTKLAFVKPDIKVGVLLVAKIDNYQNNGIRPYLNRIKRGFALGVNTFYLLARDERVEILDEVFKGLLLTGNFTLVKTPKVFEDRQGREVKCYCISINKEGAINQAYDAINQAMSTGDGLESIVTHVRADRITIDYNGVKGFVFKQNISSTSVTNPSDYFTVGMTVYAKPIEINGDGDVEFTLLGTKSDPVSIFSTYKIGMEIEATVSYVDDTFVKFTIPNNQTTAIAFRKDLTFSRFLLLHQRFPIGNTFKMIIKELELDSNNLVLQLPNLLNPWNSYRGKCGDVVEVEICKRDRNAFVGEIEEGITAVLMHSELSWLDAEQSKYLKKIKLSEVLSCTIVKIDRENEVVYVSLKHNTNNPYKDFVDSNKGKNVKIIIDSYDGFGVYGHIDNMRIFIPQSETHRGKFTYKYSVGNKVDVIVKELSQRGDSVIGTFLPLIPYHLSQFEDDYKVGDIVTGLKPSKKTDKSIFFTIRHKGENYRLLLQIKDVATEGYVGELKNLYRNISTIPLIIKEFNKEGDMVYLSLSELTKKNASKIDKIQLGEEYDGVILSRHQNGYKVLILELWVEVFLDSNKRYETGDPVKMIPERLSSPISFIDNND